MPEGPEIRRAADQIARVLVDQRIESIKFGLPRLRHFSRKLQGQLVTGIDTHGKAMLTRFDNGLTLYSHNQLYGRWYTRVRPTLPKTNRQLRVALHTATHSALLYSASDISVMDEAQLAEHPFLARLGPDILDQALTATRVRERLEQSQFRNRSLGALYLDQKFLAGLGNYLRSEILWAANLDPGLRPADLARPEITRLARETLKICQRSYRTGGVTVPAPLASKLKKRGLGFQKYRFQVYGRAGHACHSCKTKIERRDVSARALFVCPSCQSVNPR
ncbi:MAG: endonuclease VIII [Gammaproteobacteria bacterium]|nr:endonuclease VIII [Gammaproteobacteria bacterium]